MPRFTLLVTAIAMLAGCGQAAPAAPDLAPQIAKNAAMLFGYHDHDHDGRLTAAEAAPLALAGEAFAALDGDGDGALARAEFLAPARLAALDEAFRTFTEQWIGLSDEDGDGRLSRAEYDAATLGPAPGVGAAPYLDGPGAAFAAADADADGALVRAEAFALVGWLLEHGWRLMPRGGAIG